MVRKYGYTGVTRGAPGLIKKNAPFTLKTWVIYLKFSVKTFLLQILRGRVGARPFIHVSGPVL